MRAVRGALRVRRGSRGSGGFPACPGCGCELLCGGSASAPLAALRRWESCEGAGPGAALLGERSSGTAPGLLRSCRGRGVFVIECCLPLSVRAERSYRGPLGMRSWGH